MTQKTIKLSKRLCTIASFAQKGSRVADVGTDHGYIPIYLVQQGIADYAIAMDIGKGPLERAMDHIAHYGLADQIETRLSDGLAGLLPGEADTVIIAGMGGELMLRIITAGSHIRDSVARWILSPQSEPEAFRRGLEVLGLAVREEAMLCEDEKYYTVMVAEKGQMHFKEPFRYRYGDILIRRKDPVLLEFLHKEEQILGKIQKQLSDQQTDGAKNRRLEVAEALRQVKETYDAMQ